MMPMLLCLCPPMVVVVVVGDDSIGAVVSLFELLKMLKTLNALKKAVNVTYGIVLIGGAADAWRAVGSLIS